MGGQGVHSALYDRAAGNSLLRTAANPRELCAANGGVVDRRKSLLSENVNNHMKYGTRRAPALKILEDTLNLRDTRVYDVVQDENGREKRELNQKETTIAQQKQQAIKDAFHDWVWKDPTRRHELVTRYNELFNSTRPREYDGSHIVFDGMNPEITLREHQRTAIAHVLYGGNTLLAHQVGAGKTSRWWRRRWKQTAGALPEVDVRCAQSSDGTMGERVFEALSQREHW